MEQTDGKATDLQFDKNDQAQAQAKEEAIGMYVLRTNRVDLSREEISKLHRSLTTVEESFENMKGAPGLRPNFHHADIPTIAHVHVTVLAYHMLAGILKKLSTAGIHYNWNTIRDILATHIRVTTTMNTEDGHVIDVSTCTMPTEKQHMITILVNMVVPMYGYLETITHAKKNVEIQFLVFSTQCLKYWHRDGQCCL